MPDKPTVKALLTLCNGRYRDRGSGGWWPCLGNIQAWSRLSDPLAAEDEDEGKERIENLCLIVVWMTGKITGPPI